MLETIISALLGGVAAAGGKVATKAVEDAYGALKGLLVRKLGEKSDTVEAVTKLEAKPESEARKATVAEELKAANVGTDPELVEAARRLQTALDELLPEGRAHVQHVQHVQHAVGNRNAQAIDRSTAMVSVGDKRS
jgi:hypothetical protein